ncbi:phosphoglycerate dehydrogenase [candidate division KSB1 bacterium]|nr:phosphoglycerate dehydrogenase [candidate division KSB1 bacterium]
MINNIIFDFDSTIINAEGNELLVQSALQNVPDTKRKPLLDKLKEYTNKTTNGEMPLSEAMQGRFALTRVTRDDVEKVAGDILTTINPMIGEIISDLKKRRKNIFVFSTSMEQVVLPVTEKLGIPRENVFTNKPVFNRDGHITGVDEDNPLFMTMGKVYVAEKLKSKNRLSGGTAIIGDGFSDLVVKKNNLAEIFIYYSGTIDREEIRLQADFTVERFDQLLPLLSSTDEYSQDNFTSKAKITMDVVPETFLLENVHPVAVSKLKEQQFLIRNFKNAWSEQDMIEKAVNANVLGIRSKTKITSKVIQSLPDLWVIGAFCIGTNQINLDSASRAGIPVFNAPYSNTRSVAELVVGETIMLMRRTFEKSTAAHNGKWLKQAEGSSEIRGKTVGIIGYGHIGSQVSVMLENLGMSVLFHDIVDKLPLGNARRAKDLYDLLEKSDVVTLHVPDTPETRGMIGEKELIRMKRNSYLLNLSRGRVVDLVALRKILDYGHIAGAAIDVFPQEPGSIDEKFETPLQNLTNVILTPHIGGSTEEAQENIANYVSDKLSNYILTGSTIGSVNFPEIELPRVANTHRILHIHKNVPGVLAKINSVFARRNINVEGQILQTRDTIGYLIVDVNTNVSDQVYEIMKHITETIKVRRII